MLPIKTGIEDIDAVTGYLRSQVGWVAIEKIRKAIPAVHADNRKIEAMKYIGLIERDGGNVKLTDAGREYATEAPGYEKSQVLGRLMHGVNLYQSTLEWMHYSKKEAPTKTDIGNYWHDHHSVLLEGAAGAALTDGAIFFLRIADAAGLGKFIAAGRGRPETFLKVDQTALQAFVELAPRSTDSGGGSVILPPSESNAVEGQRPTSGARPQSPYTPSLSSAVRVNIEIHIAADAKASTVEEIFKNMRKYVLQAPDESNDD